MKESCTFANLPLGVFETDHFDYWPFSSDLTPVQYNNQDKNGDIMSMMMTQNYGNKYQKDPIFNRLVTNLKARYTDPTSTHPAADTASLGLIPNIDDIKDKTMKVFSAKMLDQSHVNKVLHLNFD